MARTIGSWWIKDGIDGRRIEAQGFASTLDGLPGFDWTQDHGDSAVLEKDFVETASYTEKINSVDAVQMSSHGNTDAFSVSNGSVSTSDTVRFGKTDLEIFATHACKLLEHSAAHPVGRWCRAFDRLHYFCGFHNSSYSGGGQTRAPILRDVCRLVARDGSFHAAVHRARSVEDGQRDGRGLERRMGVPALHGTRCRHLQRTAHQQRAGRSGQ